MFFFFNAVLQRVDTSILGLSEHDSMLYPYIASMGIYVFKTDVLLNLLKTKYPSSNDFGSEIIPAAVSDHNVQVRKFQNQKLAISPIFISLLFR